MREILFRGKCFHTEEWVEGYLGIEVPDELVIQQFSYDEYFKSNCIDQYSVKPETVGQYTGLTDKNGKKIFEGDILREPAKNGWEKKNFVGFEVFWHDNDSCDRHIGWQMNRLHFYGSLSGADIYPIAFRPEWTRRMEVIGNIYDNPELLEVEEHE